MRRNKVHSKYLIIEDKSELLQLEAKKAYKINLNSQSKDIELYEQAGFVVQRKCYSYELMKEDFKLDQKPSKLIALKELSQSERARIFVLAEEDYRKNHADCSPVAKEISPSQLQEILFSDMDLDYSYTSNYEDYFLTALDGAERIEVCYFGRGSLDFYQAALLEIFQSKKAISLELDTCDPPALLLQAKLSAKPVQIDLILTRE